MDSFYNNASNFIGSGLGFYSDHPRLSISPEVSLRVGQNIDGCRNLPSPFQDMQQESGPKSGRIRIMEAIRKMYPEMLESQAATAKKVDSTSNKEVKSTSLLEVDSNRSSKEFESTSISLLEIESPDLSAAEGTSQKGLNSCLSQNEIIEDIAVDGSNQTVGVNAATEENKRVSPALEKFCARGKRNSDDTFITPDCPLQDFSFFV
ncbi:uncharacterized protein LOC103462023 [Poecilia reticulata]|uniref:uncharacterized protein LOC103462023 n=1 Tax=Poecilia reticulata TaxID=8081 RepID=UPI0004A3B47A|nr:PREDICTED: uncharacterized protein LOC103462023 [Poecilia reticulata]